MRILVAAALTGALFCVPAQPQSVGNGQLLIAGSRLTVSPISQTVPYDTPTIVETHLEGFDAALGSLPTDLRVLADFSGAGIDNFVTLETVPNQPFQIPGLSLKGDYQLDNIRLMQGDTLLGFGEPRSVAISVTQILVTTVTSRPLTLDEIRSYGIVVDDDNFQAFNFTFGFGVDGDVVDYNVPVLWAPGKEQSAFILGGRQPSSGRFRPPQLMPFFLEKQEAPGEEFGGCEDPLGDCDVSAPLPLPGAIIFPTDSSLLNQFFSVVLMVQNGAPAGDPLTVRDLTAQISLPLGLRQAETEPPTPLGVPVPVRVPGPDGELGTADDVTFLVAQAAGEAEFLLEGLKEGTHVVDFKLQGVLEGLPSGIQQIEGSARGAVIVRDPTFGITISHPDVVRRDEEYSMRLTVANTSNAPANLVSIRLPASRLSGVELVDPAAYQKVIETLLPGESELLEFRLRALLTGRVVAASVRSDSHVSPTFDLTVGVGENGIPLSPNSIVLPKATDALPAELVRRGLNLVGLGFSLATAPSGLLNAKLPQVTREAVDARVQQLADAGRRIALGEDLFDSAAVLAASWNGAWEADWEWDRLRRTTRSGAQVGAELSTIFAAEASTSSLEAMFDRFVGTSAYLPPLNVVLASGNGTQLEVSSLTSGFTVAGGGLELDRSRDLPFADLYDLTTGEMVLLSVPEPNGYQVRLRSDAAASIDLHVMVTVVGAQLRKLSWRSIALGAGGLAVVDVSATSTTSTLFVDTNGDGIVDDQIPAQVANVQPRPFRAISAVQVEEVDPTGHVVNVLFSGDVDLSRLEPSDPVRFSIPGKLSNGGPSVDAPAPVVVDGEPVRGTFADALSRARVVQVVFNNPLSPYTEQILTVNDVWSALGEPVVSSPVSVQTAISTPGTLVQGRVLGPDGEPVPFAVVALREVDFNPLTGDCIRHTTATVQADARGDYLFDYVRDTFCGGIFTLDARDPGSDHRGSATGRVRFIAETVRLNIVMLGRGGIRGQVQYDDGSPVENLRVVATSAQFNEGRLANVDEFGNYEVGDLPVGTVNVVADDRHGNFAVASVSIPSSGALVERDLTIFRGDAAGIGELRGTVFDPSGVEPVFDAWIALYSDGELIGVRRSDLSGRFDFGMVPAGLAEIEAFDAVTGKSGLRIFFEVLPDRVNEIDLVLRDERGAVEGTVSRTEFGVVTAVDGAIVHAAGTPFHTTTDANGHYRLEEVFAGQQSIIAVSGTQTVSETVTVVDGVTAVRDLLFSDAGVNNGAITGVVLDYNGLPVSGATLHLEVSPTQWFKQALTNLQGEFVLSNVSPRAWRVHAIRGNDGGVAVANVRFAGDTPFVTVRFKKGTIRGVVQSENESGVLAPAPSVVRYRTTVVRLDLVGLDIQDRFIETDASGNFEILDALVGPYQLTVSNAFHGDTSISGELVQHGEVAFHQLLLKKNGIIRGRVLDHDGVTPVAGVRVNLRHPRFSNFELFTGADGTFQFELVPPDPRPFPIDAFFEDGTAYRLARVSVCFNQLGQVLDVELVLPKQGSLSGFVEDSNGTRIAAAEVTLQESLYPNQRFVVLSAEDGSFAFSNVFAGTVAVSAEALSLGGLGGRTTAKLVGEEEAISGVIVRLEEVGQIVGRVLSPVDGSPVPSAEVRLSRSSLVDTTNTDAQGRFTFKLLPLATYGVQAFDPSTGRQGAQSGLTLTANNEVLETDVLLQGRGEVDGHLLEPVSHAPVLGATVALDTLALTRLTTYTSTDATGLFFFPGIPQGGFLLRAQEPDGRRKASGGGEIAGEGDRVTVDLFLEGSGAISGSVLNPPGLPAGLFSPANVLLSQDGQLIDATLANPFQLDGIIVGRSFRVEAHEVGGPHRAVATGILADPNELLNIDLVMQPFGSVAVSVVDAAGVPVTGTDVTVASSGFYLNSFTGGTGVGNAVTFDGVGVGSFSVFADSPTLGLSGSASGALLFEGETVSVTVQLQAAGKVRGVLMLADGVTPAEGALAVLTRPLSTLTRIVEPNGSFFFPSVPLGAFQLDFQESLGPGTLQLSGSVDANGQVVDLGVLTLDDRDPTVVDIQPADGSIGVPVQPEIRVVFSESIDLAAFAPQQVTLGEIGGGDTIVSRTWSVDARTLTIAPQAPLSSFTAYRVRVVAGVRDPAGRTLSDSVQATFTTEDVEPPRVTDVSPAPGAVQVALDAAVHLIFSEPVVAASLNGSSLALKDLTTGGILTTTSLLLSGEREVVLTPVAGLQEDHDYSVTATGMADRFGNVQTAVFSSTFETLDATPPVVELLAVPGPLTEGVDYVLSALQIGGDDLASVSFFRGADLLTSDAAPPFEAVFVPSQTNAEAGLVELSAVGIDRAGNVGAPSVLIRSVTPDLPPELTAQLEPADQIFRDQTLVVSGVATDSSGIAQVTIVASGAVVGEVTLLAGSNPSLSFQHPLPVPLLSTQGFIEVVVRAQDRLGKITELAPMRVAVLDDLEPPIILSVAPPAGSSFTSGDPIVIAAEATDNVRILETRFSLNGQSFIDTTAPYSWETVAPSVTLATTFTASVEVEDSAGNVSTQNRNLEVAPLFNPDLPTVAILCPANGDAFLPGFDLTFSFDLADDQALSGYSIYVDGLLALEVTGLNQASLSTNWAWAPPATAQPGDLAAVRIEARDFAGNVGTAELSLSYPLGARLVAGSVLDTLSGQSIVIEPGRVTLSEPVALVDMTLVQGSTLVGQTLENFNLTASGTLRVSCGASIDVTGQGYAGGTLASPEGGVPAFVLGSLPDAGGSHGGSGSWAHVADTAGEVYDSVYAPRYAGGGGALDNDNSGDGLSGGGVLDLQVGTLVLEGELRALGEGSVSRLNSSGGGGGSVSLVAGLVSGAGVIDVSGGEVNNCFSSSNVVGSGGAGRAALEVSLFSGFDPAVQVISQGGIRRFCTNAGEEYGAAGTVYVLGLTDTHGKLYVDQGGTNGLPTPATVLPTIGVGTIAVAQPDATDPTSLWIEGQLTDPLPSLGVTGMWVRVNGVDYRVIDQSADRTRLLLAGAAGLVTVLDAYQGVYKFDQVQVSGGAQLVFADRAEIGLLVLSGGGSLDATAPVEVAVLEVPAGRSSLPQELTVTSDLTVRSGAAVTAGVSGELHLTVPGTLTVELGASIDVTGQGYAGGTVASPEGGSPEFVLGSVPDAGGSHGGSGSWGHVADTAGEVYDSVYAPRYAGGGGALDNDGSGDGFAGGGVLDLVVGTLVLEGELRALGEGSVSRLNSSGGGGGSVSLVADVLSGAGVIDVSGGEVNNCFSSSQVVGSGGAGRAALAVSSFSGFDPAVQVISQGGIRRFCENAGEEYGAAGTLYVLEPTDTHGKLYVDQGGTNGLPTPATVLPTIGVGTIAFAQPEPTDPTSLWIEGQVTDALPSLGVTGMWVRVNGSDYRVLDQSADRTRLLLAGAAGLVTVLDPYQGVYKFDQVHVSGGAELVFADRAEIGLLVLSSGGSLDATAPVEVAVLEVPDGTSSLPQELTVTGDLTVRSGSVVTAGVSGELHLTVPGTLTVELGASIDVTGQGYLGGTSVSPEGGTPEFVLGSLPDAGGSHGGWGSWGHVADTAGEVYGSVYVPRYAGGGGALDNDGSGDGFAGGGVLDLVVGTLVLEGELRALGGGVSSNRGAGGGGGSVSLVATVVSGAGVIDVSGGAVNNCGTSSRVVVGSGGAGRAALEVGLLSGFNPALQVISQGGIRRFCDNAGEEYGAAGTLYVLEPTDTHGKLYVDQGGTNGLPTPATVLPTIGVGTIAVAAPDVTDPTSLWIEGQLTDPLPSLGVTGMWVRVNSIDYRVLDQSADRTQLLLAGAAGLVTVSDTYEGVYKFDQVHVSGGAQLVFLDVAEVGQFFIELGSSVSQP